MDDDKARAVLERERAALLTEEVLATTVVAVGNSRRIQRFNQRVCLPLQIRDMQRRAQSLYHIAVSTPRASSLVTAVGRGL